MADFLQKNDLHLFSEKVFQKNILITHFKTLFPHQT